MLLDFVSKLVVTYADHMNLEREVILTEAINETKCESCYNCTLPVTKECKTAVRCKCGTEHCLVLFCKQTTACVVHDKWHGIMECNNCNARALLRHSHFTCKRCQNFICDRCAIKCTECDRIMCRSCCSICGTCGEIISCIRCKHEC
jgi:hypothetical protein